MEFLSKRETKNTIQQIQKQFGIKSDLNYTFLKAANNKIFITTNDIKNLNLEDYKINSAGLYIGQIQHNEIRLSIEGSQLLGPKSTKNIFKIQDPANWLKGKNIECKEKFKGFVLIKYKNDFLGCGRFKDNKILNYVPKVRRLLDITFSKNTKSTNQLQSH